MVTKREDGGSAFPNDGQWANGVPEQGATMRDYFAAKVMQGMIAGAMSDGTKMKSGDPEILARSAYIIADAMLAERAK